MDQPYLYHAHRWTDLTSTTYIDRPGVVEGDSRVVRDRGRLYEYHENEWTDLIGTTQKYGPAVSVPRS